ncbi:hypothetical protein C8J57DRAFT_1222654 [Mycena rebaudengoi]|nr:hypothetical protein C8J57DRAFT_1222654 [Mycena rebaudengoi]
MNPPGFYGPDPPPSQTKSINPLLQSGLMTEDIEMGAVGCKRKWEEGPGEEGGPDVHPAETVNAAVRVRRSTRPFCQKWFTVHVLGLTWPNLGKRVNLAVVMASDGLPVPVTAPVMESPGYPQYSTCSARPSKNCLAFRRRDGAVHGTAVTSTRLSSDISMGYSILDLNVTLRVVRLFEYIEALPGSRDSQGRRTLSNGPVTMPRTSLALPEAKQNVVKFGNTSMVKKWSHIYVSPLAESGLSVAENTNPLRGCDAPVFQRAVGLESCAVAVPLSSRDNSRRNQHDTCGTGAVEPWLRSWMRALLFNRNLCKEV